MMFSVKKWSLEQSTEKGDKMERSKRRLIRVKGWVVNSVSI